MTVERGGDDAIVASRRLHAAIDVLDQAAADMLGISRNDLRCLNLLEHGPVPPSRIAAALRLTSGSVTTLVDRLERKGFVQRSPDPHDRRGVQVCATPLVFQTVGELYRSCAQIIRGTFEAYPPGEQAHAVKHLHDAAAAWEQAVTGAASPGTLP